MYFFTYSQLPENEKKMEAIYARGRNNSESLGYWPTLTWDLWQWELDYQLTIILTTVRHQVSSGFGVLFPFSDLIFSSYHTLAAFLFRALPLVSSDSKVPPGPKHPNVNDYDISSHPKFPSLILKLLRLKSWGGFSFQNLRKRLHSSPVRNRKWELTSPHFFFKNKGWSALISIRIFYKSIKVIKRKLWSWHKNYRKRHSIQTERLSTHKRGNILYLKKEMANLGRVGSLYINIKIAQD